MKKRILKKQINQNELQKAGEQLVKENEISELAQKENKIIENMLNLTQEDYQISSPDLEDRADNSISRWKRHNLNILMQERQQTSLQFQGFNDQIQSERLKRGCVLNKNDFFLKNRQRNYRDELVKKQQLFEKNSIFGCENDCASEKELQKASKIKQRKNILKENQITFLNYHTLSPTLRISDLNEKQIHSARFQEKKSNLLQNKLDSSIEIHHNDSLNKNFLNQEIQKNCPNIIHSVNRINIAEYFQSKKVVKVEDISIKNNFSQLNSNENIHQRNKPFSAQNSFRKKSNEINEINGQNKNLNSTKSNFQKNLKRPKTTQILIQKEKNLENQNLQSNTLKEQNNINQESPKPQEHINRNLVLHLQKYLKQKVFNMKYEQSRQIKGIQAPKQIVQYCQQQNQAHLMNTKALQTLLNNSNPNHFSKLNKSYNLNNSKNSLNNSIEINSSYDKSILQKIHLLNSSNIFIHNKQFPFPSNNKIIKSKFINFRYQV